MGISLEKEPAGGLGVFQNVGGISGSAGAPCAQAGCRSYSGWRGSATGAHPDGRVQSHWRNECGLKIKLFRITEGCDLCRHGGFGGKTGLNMPHHSLRHSFDFRLRQRDKTSRCFPSHRCRDRALLRCGSGTGGSILQVETPPALINSPSRGLQPAP